MDRIRERREKLGLTQGELASLAAVHQSQVSNAEGGKHISAAARSKILAALSVAETRPTSNETDDAGIPENMGTVGKFASMLEVSLGAAFDHHQHLLRDAIAVQRAFENIALPAMSALELQALCRQWLDAAAQLRASGTPVTAQAIVATVTISSMRTH